MTIATQSSPSNKSRPERKQRTDTRRLLYWIEEREKIRRARAAGKPPPWTADKILGEYRFTNVRREDDKVTRWILDKWVYPFADDIDLWFGAVIARFVNWPETLDELGYPVPWDPKHFLDVMAAREARGAKRYGGAYMIHADNTGLKRPTPLYQVEEVFGPLWDARAGLRPKKGDALEGYLARFKPFSNMGNGFMPAQVIGDLKYVKPLRSARDRMTFAVSGPGSRRGLNRLLGRPVDASWSERNWRTAFDGLRKSIQGGLERLGLGDLDAQSLQSCLCEYDKMERERLGEGHPKNRYTAKATAAA